MSDSGDIDHKIQGDEQYEDVVAIDTPSVAPVSDEEVRFTWRTFAAVCALYVEGLPARASTAHFLSRALSYGSLLGVGSNMTGSVLANIAAEFNETRIQGWISSGNLLGATIGVILAGRLSDIFGRRDIILVGNVLGVAGMAMCAFTSNFSVS